MVSVDIYRNETSRHADVILPAPSALEKPHYDVALLQLAVRNVANWSEPVLPLPDGQPDEWEVLARLALIAQGWPGADADPAVVDDLVIGALIGAAVADEHGPLHGRDADELLAALAPRTGPGADHRLLPAQRPLRRPLRRQPGRADARRPDRRAARHRPRAAASRACPTACARRPG